MTSHRKNTLPVCLQEKHFIRLCQKQNLKESDLLDYVQKNDICFRSSTILAVTAFFGMWDLTQYLYTKGVPTKGALIHLAKNCRNNYSLVHQLSILLASKLDAEEAGQVLELCSTFCTISVCEALVRDLLSRGYRPADTFVTEYYELPFIQYLAEIDPECIKNAYAKHPETGVHCIQAIDLLVSLGVVFNYSETLLMLISRSINKFTMQLISQLIQLGADVNYKQGSPYAHSLHYNQQEISQLLEAAGADKKLASNTLYVLLKHSRNFSIDLEDCLYMGADPNSCPETLVEVFNEMTFENWSQLLDRLVAEHGMTLETVERVILATHKYINGFNIKDFITYAHGRGLNLAMGGGFFLRKLFDIFPVAADLKYLEILLAGGCKISENNYEALMLILPGCSKDVFRDYILGTNLVLPRHNPRVRRFLGMDLKFYLGAYNSKLTMMTSYPEEVLGDVPNRSYEDDYMVVKGEGKIDYIYAVFDGHGGRLRAKTAPGRAYVTCQNHIAYAAIYGDNITSLSRFIEIEIDKLADPCIGVEDAIKQAFVSFDEAALAAGYIAGTCVSMVISVVGQKYVVNLGDSRTIVYNQENSQILFQTRDHDATNPAEVERVIAAGGKVITGRINQSLMVFRTLGDYKFKFNKTHLYDPINGAASAVPEVTRLSIPSGVHKARVIITSDAPYSSDIGLSCQDMVEITQGRTAQQAARLVAPYTTDDLTILSFGIEN